MHFSARTSRMSDSNPELNVTEEHKFLMRQLAKTRERKFFQELFVYFAPRVKALMMKSGADSAEAEDLVQDVMMTVWRKVDLYVPEKGTVSAWIFTIARNARIDRLRRGSSQPYEDVQNIHLASDEADGEESALLNQRACKVAEALAVLPEEQRKIIEMSYMEDLPQSEIAEKLDLPIGTVKSRMRLAYAKLRTILEELR